MEVGRRGKKTNKKRRIERAKIHALSASHAAPHAPARDTHRRLGLWLLLSASPGWCRIQLSPKGACHLLVGVHLGYGSAADAAGAAPLAPFAGKGWWRHDGTTVSLASSYCILTPVAQSPIGAVMQLCRLAGGARWSGGACCKCPSLARVLRPLHLFPPEPPSSLLQCINGIRQRVSSREGEPSVQLCASQHRALAGPLRCRAYAT